MSQKHFFKCYIFILFQYYKNQLTDNHLRIVDSKFLVLKNNILRFVEKFMIRKK